MINKYVDFRVFIKTVFGPRWGIKKNCLQTDQLVKYMLFQGMHSHQFSDDFIFLIWTESTSLRAVESVFIYVSFSARARQITSTVQYSKQSLSWTGVALISPTVSAKVFYNPSIFSGIPCTVVPWTIKCKSSHISSIAQIGIRPTIQSSS